MGSRPLLTAEEALAIAHDLWDGRFTVVKELPSYDDRNYLLSVDETADEGGKCGVETRKVVLKVTNADDPPTSAECQNLAMIHVHAALGPDTGYDVSVPIPMKGNGDLMRSVDVRVDEEDEATRRPCVVRMLTFLPGRTLGDGPLPVPCPALRDLGRKLAHMDAALRDFSHPFATHRTESEWDWDITRCDSVVRGKIGFVTDSDLREAVEKRTEEYERCHKATAATLPRQVAHNDANVLNVLGNEDSVTAFIDFGDIALTTRAGNLAITVAYAMLGAPSTKRALECGTAVVAGYAAGTDDLSQEEKAVIFSLATMRICVSITVSLDAAAKDPTNAYILHHLDQNRTFLNQIEGIDAARGSRILFGEEAYNADE